MGDEQTHELSRRVILAALRWRRADRAWGELIGGAHDIADLDAGDAIDQELAAAELELAVAIDALVGVEGDHA